MKNPQKAPPKPSQNKIIRKDSSSDYLHVPIPVKPDTFFSVKQVEMNKQHILAYNAYKQMRAEFSLSPKSSIMLRRVVTDSKISLDLKRLPLLLLLTETSEEMMLNDLEIMVWALYLERFVWNETCIPFKAMLFITALAVKSYMNESVLPYQAYLSAKFSNFSGAYNS